MGEILINICVIFAILAIVFVIYRIISDTLKMDRDEKFYKIEFADAGLELNKAYDIEINGKTFIFEPIKITSMGIQYFWVDLHTGATSLFRLTNMEELKTHTFKLHVPN